MNRARPLSRTLQCVAVTLIAAAGTVRAQNILWLNQDPNDGGLYETKNPTPGVVVGHQVTLYVWLTKSAVFAGYDGISLDVQVQSTDGGRVSTQMVIDNDHNRWSAVYAGTPLTGTGGTGIDNANAIDLTNTDTIPTDPFRFARLTFTAEQTGTVKVFLGIGNKGIADNGAVTTFNIGMSTNTTTPEPLNILGGSYGAISNVPEAVITVLPGLSGDYDADTDVDLADFSHFQACFNGPNRTPAQGGCDDADADDDSDVDLADFSSFQACFNGPNNPPACL